MFVKRKMLGFQRSCQNFVKTPVLFWLRLSCNSKAPEYGLKGEFQVAHGMFCFGCSCGVLAIS